MEELLPFRPDTAAWPLDFELPPPRPVEVQQWISAVPRSSSEFGRDGQWVAQNIAGPPRVQSYADDPLAWAPQNIGHHYEWVEVQIAKSCRVRRIDIHESLCGGALTRVSLWDADRNRFVVVHEQRSRCGQYPHQMRVETVQLNNNNNPRIINNPPASTNLIKLEFDPSGGQSWYEIDAIQVYGYDLEADNDYANNLSEVATALGGLVGDAKTADCTLVVQDEKIPVHRGILAARCPYFRALVDRGEMPCGGQVEFQNNNNNSNVSPALLKLVLEWLYTGHIQKNFGKNRPRDCVCLLVAADYLSIDSLVAFCTRIFQKAALAVETAPLLLAYYDRIGVTALYQAALEYCGEHFLKVSQTPAFQNLSQAQLLAVIECYNQHRLTSETEQQLETETISHHGSVTNDDEEDDRQIMDDDERAEY